MRLLGGLEVLLVVLVVDSWCCRFLVLVVYCLQSRVRGVVCCGCGLFRNCLLVLLVFVGLPFFLSSGGGQGGAGGAGGPGGPTVIRLTQEEAEAVGRVGCCGSLSFS